MRRLQHVATAAKGRREPCSPSARCTCQCHWMCPRNSRDRCCNMLESLLDSTVGSSWIGSRQWVHALDNSSRFFKCYSWKKPMASTDLTFSMFWFLLSSWDSDRVPCCSKEPGGQIGGSRFLGVLLEMGGPSDIFSQGANRRGPSTWQGGVIWLFQQ